ncbi:hypothetical protein CIB48_g5911 [Xylaria polymorpha]|nr:hypothetical protein CIB48_g5911 [Xylaria polymorpha]
MGVFLDTSRRSKAVSGQRIPLLDNSRNAPNSPNSDFNYFRNRKQYPPVLVSRLRIPPTANSNRKGLCNATKDHHSIRSLVNTPHLQRTKSTLIALVFEAEQPIQDDATNWKGAVDATILTWRRGVVAPE